MSRLSAEAVAAAGGKEAVMREDDRPLPSGVTDRLATLTHLLNESCLF